MVSYASDTFIMKVASSDVEKYYTVFIYFSKIILKLTPVYAIIRIGKGNENFYAYQIETPRDCGSWGFLSNYLQWQDQTI